MYPFIVNSQTWSCYFWCYSILELNWKITALFIYYFIYQNSLAFVFSICILYQTRGIEWVSVYSMHNICFTFSSFFNANNLECWEGCIHGKRIFMRRVWKVVNIYPCTVKTYYVVVALVVGYWSELVSSSTSFRRVVSSLNA